MKILQAIQDQFKKRTVLFLAAIVMGVILGRIAFSDSYPEHPAHDSSQQVNASTYTCSMHPQVRLSEPGQCPICFMDLIPLEGSKNNLSDREISLSKEARTLARVRTTPVRSGRSEYMVALTGRIDYDETRVKNISAWFPGRLERLFVDYTGIPVTKGDHLFDIYSPQLYSAQEELLQAQKRMKTAGPNLSFGRGLEAAREKARLLGLTERQIESILMSGLAKATLQINSPMSGIVTQKTAVEGKYVKTGEEIYTIADLSHVWLILEAYEKDLPWLAYGQNIDFSVAGIPGKRFDARISYIDPLVNERSRTVTVRAVLDNREGDLKPGMLVQARISAELDARGKVMTPDLTGKWTCPMHPEVLKSNRGQCDVCGMDLVPIRSESGNRGEAEGLLIPASAVLKTGHRALIYVEKSNADPIIYELREVVLGPRVGDEYLVLEGLRVGEKVVTAGNFKIDSAMQIAGKLSMMNMPERRSPVTLSDVQSHGLRQLTAGYLTLQTSLAKDDLKGANRALKQISDGLPELMQDFDPQMGVSPTLQKLKTQSRISSSTLSEVRSHFEDLSNLMIQLQNHVDLDPSLTLYKAFCPMAFDNKGASWLQAGQEINNPYFGDTMLRCGEIQETYLAREHSHE